MLTASDIWGPSLPRPTGGAAALAVLAEEFRDRAVNHIWVPRGLPWKMGHSVMFFAAFESPQNAHPLLTRSWAGSDQGHTPQKIPFVSS